MSQKHALVMALVACVSSAIETPTSIFDMASGRLSDVVGDDGIEPRYGHVLIADAGSTHTQFTLYKFTTPLPNYTATTLGPCCHEELPYVCDIPAVGTTSSEQVYADTSNCLLQAKTNLSEIAWRKTPFYMRATAGLRLLNMTNSALVTDQLSQVRSAVARLIPQCYNAGEEGTAKIMPGGDEGAFGWVATNYLAGLLHHALRASHISRRAVQEVDTVAALDMGGASTQITFVPGVADGAADPQDVVKLKLYDNDIDLYSKSYLCYGVKRALRRRLAHLINSTFESGVVHDTCLPRGYSYNLTTADINEFSSDPCLDGVLPTGFLNDAGCEIVGTGESSLCFNATKNIFDGDFTSAVARQPSLSSQTQLYAFSNFYSTIQFLFKSTQTPCANTCNRNILQMKAQANTICGIEWDALQQAHPQIKPEYLMAYCGSAMYEIQLLSKYGINEEFPILFAGSVAGTKVGWNFGFALNATTSLPTIVDDINNKPSGSSDVPDEIWIAFGTSVGVILIVFVGYFGYGCFCRQKSNYVELPMQDLSGGHGEADKDDDIFIDDVLDANEERGLSIYEDNVYEDEAPTL